MKKYTQPELSISMFDIEDVITNSGEMTTAATVIEELGQLFTSTDATAAEATIKSNAAYFGWKAD